MHEQSGSETNIKYYGKNCSNEKFSKAVEIILEEMKKKDEIIKELKYQNEILQKKVEELTNKSDHNTSQQPLSFHSPSLSYTHSSKTNIIAKLEIKQFLQETKGKIPSDIFKQFIYYIKLLTDKEMKNKSEIINKIKILFGYEYYDLFQKFQSFVTIK